MHAHFESCTTPHDCWCETKRYGLIFGIALIIFTLEVLGGIFSQSLALLADAGHVFIDASATLVAILVSYYVKRHGNEPLVRKIGGYINALLLGGISVWIAIESIERFYHPREISSNVLIVVAVLGTLGNYVQYKILDAANEKHVTHASMRLHVLSDLWQSIAVIVGGVLIWLTGWILIDPILSMGIAIMMFRWTWQLLSALWTGQYDQYHGHCSHSHHNHE